MQDLVHPQAGGADPNILYRIEWTRVSRNSSMNTLSLDKIDDRLVSLVIGVSLIIAWIVQDNLKNLFLNIVFLFNTLPVFSNRESAM